VNERATVAAGGVLGIVPARAGSKGVPGKNIKLLRGRPLLEYTARAAEGSGVLDRVVLTTESPEIAEVGRRVGFDVPFLRPAALSADDTPMLPVLQHVLSTLADGGWVPRLVVLLQPTSPLRRPAHIARAVTMLEESDATSVVSVVELPRHLSPDYVMRIEGGVLKPFLADGLRITRRQDARAAYVRDGTVYAFRPGTLERFGDIYGDDCRPLLIPADESLSIDSPADWDAAERMLARAE
jgi:CMP-N,N'-diacetyllegionaminic acid synthase